MCTRTNAVVRSGGIYNQVNSRAPVKPPRPPPRGNKSRDLSTAITCRHPPVVARRRIMSSNLLISDEALRPSESMMFVLLHWHTGCS